MFLSLRQRPHGALLEQLSRIFGSPGSPLPDSFFIINSSERTGHVSASFIVTAECIGDIDRFLLSVLGCAVCRTLLIAESIEVSTDCGVDRGETVGVPG